MKITRSFVQWCGILPMFPIIFLGLPHIMDLMLLAFQISCLYINIKTIGLSDDEVDRKAKLVWRWPIIIAKYVWINYIKNIGKWFVS